MATTASPAIACIGIIGKSNNPLHIAIFPTSSSPTSSSPSASTAAAPPTPPTPTPPTASPAPPTPLLTPLQTSLLLSTTLDIFAARARANTLAGRGLSADYGLLKSVDERLAVYGWETNTGVKIVVGVDGRGREEVGGRGGRGGREREGEMKVVFRAIQAAYTRLLQNPFYDPDEHGLGPGRGRMIESKRFAEEIRRIGEGWRAGSGTV